ncbi:MAG: carbon-nitrogen hydrolase family protein, partial [Planctomycetota bacterium]
MRRLLSNPRPLLRLFFIIFVFGIFFESDNSLLAANTAKKVGKKKGYIKIATIGSGPAAVSADTEPQKIVEKMIAHWQKIFAQVLPDRPDLIVVPEACDRPGGFSLEKLRLYYQVRKDQIQKYFAKIARENNCYIVYSAHREMPDGTRRNSSVLIDRNGNVAGIYNKNHPTIGEIEKGILCGRDAPVIECDFGRVAMAICFDLNF